MAHRDAEQELEALRSRIRRLEGALAARDDFIAVIGHELRNPLSPVLLDLDHLRDAARRAGDTVSAPWLEQRIDTLSARFRRFCDRLDRILDVSRISAGRLELDLEPVDLAEVTRDVCDDLERQRRVTGSPIELRLSAVVGLWDRIRVEQIVSNLLGNAIRYGAGEPIEVVVDATETDARLVVSDQGVGIPKNELPHLFEQFERGGARRRHSSGFGVGLWLTHKLCVAMGGAVEVDSEPDVGSTFTVTLPRGVIP